MECLPFKYLKNNDVEWLMLAFDDFIAEIKLIGITYELRVEQMDKNAWWGCFYVNNVLEWDNNGKFQKTEITTKRQVVKALNLYRMNNCKILSVK